MFIKLPHVLKNFPLLHAHNQNYPHVPIEKTTLCSKKKLSQVPIKKNTYQKKKKEHCCTCKARVMRLVYIYY